MKIGTETSSLVNHLYSRMVVGQPTPEVGMGATVLSWTDRYAATIYEVEKSGRAVLVRVSRDTAKVVSGSAHDGSAEYAFTPNAQGTKATFRQRKDGTWEEVYWNRETRRWKRHDGGSGLLIGRCEEHRDPSF
ncbi:hypothetical protein PQJ75_00785 [Rhodoplanes sp. TEM]|uniref:Uncharacterized protein n=1 Tax=Rhodoplanes tepidamans TaxID=200616 RepID=A0ABT5J5J0_RHOTP|nr:MULTISPECIES: hypothetical protein [Rhodoplanes]MDC7784788.1 hypothetical protein [Rhodoplanes tepidamans]MDC7982255.1 hypothetical protein [Rhodoplanes sp. TEM]MDQ0356262.1 hypothetical protein [Rhodoplanes tepidamans]